MTFNDTTYLLLYFQDCADVCIESVDDIKNVEVRSAINFMNSHFGAVCNSNMCVGIHNLKNLVIPFSIPQPPSDYKAEGLRLYIPGSKEKISFWYNSGNKLEIENFLFRDGKIVSGAEAKYLFYFIYNQGFAKLWGYEVFYWWQEKTKAMNSEKTILFQ